MLRFTALVGFVVACVLALGLDGPPASARDIDPSFKQFEEPPGQRLKGRCKTPEIIAHLEQIRSAIGRMTRKIERMERAKGETMTQIEGSVGDVQAGFTRDLIEINRWQEHWKAYKKALEEQAAYYAALPDCPSRAPPTRLWVAPPEPPLPVTPSRTPVCPVPPGSTLETFVKGNAGIDKMIDDLAAEAHGLLTELAGLTARGLGGGQSADTIRRRLHEIYARIAFLEQQRTLNNLRINAIERDPPCEPTTPPPTSTESSSVTPPAGDMRTALGECEAGVLVALNAARADPAGYAAGLRSARGQAAAEARDFLAGQQPLAGLTADPLLTAAAKAHAEDLARRDVVGHTGADGSGPLRRFQAQGLFVTLAGEVIAVSQSTGEGAVRQLVIDQGNPGGPHRKDLFNANFTRVGIACIRTRSHGQIVVINLSNEPMARD